MLLRFGLAAFTAAAIVCSSGLQEVRKDLADSDPAVRAQAAKVLGEARDHVSVPKLIELLEDSEVDVRKAGARALGRIGDSLSAEPLARMYGREKHEDAAEVAVRALVELGEPSVQSLLRLIRVGGPYVRAGAARALGKLRAKAAVTPLIALLETDRNADVRIAAVYALRQIGDERGMEAVSRAVQDEDQDVEAAAEKALGGRGYNDQLDRARRVLRHFR